MNDKDTKILEEKYSEICEALNNKTINSILGVIVQALDAGDFNNAKEQLNNLKAIKIAGKSIAEMPEYQEIFSGLHSKLDKSISDKNDASMAARIQRDRENSPEVVFNDAKQCIFKNAKLGYMNGWGNNSNNFKILELHANCQKLHPEKHKFKSYHPYGSNRGIEDNSCSCGLEYGIDSTD